MKIFKRLYKTQKELILLLILLFEFIYPYDIALAQQVFGGGVTVSSDDLTQNQTELAGDEGKITSVKPILQIQPKVDVAAPQVEKTYKLIITAYNSAPEQTDSTPCITANGFDLCEHNTEDVAAANFLPFGTKIRIPEIFGDRIFTIQDRMNARYYYRVDVWFKDLPTAKTFGAKYATIEVIE